MRAVAALIVGIVIGGGGAKLLLDDEPGPRTKTKTIKPSILCETDADQIAEAYAESGVDTDLQVDCQQAGNDPKHPLAGVSLAPEYRCLVKVQLASNPYQLTCDPLP